MIINKNTKLSDITGLEKLTIDRFNQIAYCIDRCKHTGLVLAEFEFESLAEANKFAVPSILDCVEVTGDKKYTNLELSKA